MLRNAASKIQIQRLVPVFGRKETDFDDCEIRPSVVLHDTHPPLADWHSAHVNAGTSEPEPSCVWNQKTL